MSQRCSRVSRLSLAEQELAAIAATGEHGTMTCFNRFLQTIRGERPLNHVALVLRLSLLTNVLIVTTMTAIAITAHSLALLSALAENVIDLVVQGILVYAGTCSGKSLDNAKFPAGTSRFEPVAVIVAAAMMVLGSVFFIQEGVAKIVGGFMHDNPEKPELSVSAVVIVSVAISTKVFLMMYSRWVLTFTSSVAAQAIQDDNRNDVISNTFAIVAYVVASAHEKLWYIDPAGAMLVFFFIMISWARMGKEQVLQLVGVTATAEFIHEIQELCNTHNTKLALDVVRAYHLVPSILWNWMLLSRPK